MAKTESLRIRATPQLKARLAAQAKIEERSMSSLLMFVLKTYLDERDQERQKKKK